MDGAILPLTFYCRNAQLCLQKACESENSDLPAEELQHLKAFTTLVSTTIPSHPLYRDRKEERHLQELHSHLSTASKRIQELESEDPSRRTFNDRPYATTNGRVVRQKIETPPPRSVKSKPRSPQKESSKSSSDSMSKPPKSVRIAAPKPRPEGGQRWDITWSPNMNDTYGVVAKTSTSSVQRPISLIQRLKRGAVSLNADQKSLQHHQQNGKDTTRAPPLQNPAAGEIAPYRPRSRDASRSVRGSGTMSTISSRSQAKVPVHSSKIRSLEMAPYENHDTYHEKSANANQALVAPGMTHNVHVSENGVVSDECVVHHSASVTEYMMRTRDIGNEEAKEMIRGSKSGVVSGKQKLTNSGGWLRGILRRGDDSEVVPMGQSLERAGSRGSMQSNGVAVETNDEEDHWTEMGVTNVRDSPSTEARDGGYGDESTVSDGRKYPYHQGGAVQERKQSSRGDGLREWKGGFVRGEKTSEVDVENGGYSERSSPARMHNRRLDIARKVDNRPASAPRRMQGAASERKVKQIEKLETAGSEREIKISGSFKAKAVKCVQAVPSMQGGVKEDCERFRQQMKMLKERTQDSRKRELEVEGMADRLQRRLIDEMDLAGGREETRQKQALRGRNGENGDIRDEHRLGRSATLSGGDRGKMENGEKAGHARSEGSSLSRNGVRLKGETSPLQGKPARRDGDCNLGTSTEFEFQRGSPSVNGGRPSYGAGAVTASTSGSSSSSLSSLPLSHYMQKLRHLAPESRFPSTPTLEMLTPNEKAATSNHTHLQHEPVVSSNGHAYGPATAITHKFSPETTDTGFSSTPMSYPAAENERELSLSSPGSSAILLPTTSSSTHALHRPLAPRYNNNRFGLYTSHIMNNPPPHILSKTTPRSDSSSCAMLASPEQHVNAILGGCAMVAGHLQEEGKLTPTNALEQFYLPPDVTHSRGFGRSIYENAHHEANDEKMANIQRVLGELKGSVEGVKIRIEVEGEGWRGRVQGLEKEIENLKEESDDEIIAAKHSIRNELKIKLGDLAADVEKTRREEREQVQMLVDERIEKQLGNSEMKSEIRLLWAEMEALSKSREEMQGHVDHLTAVAQKAQEHASHEQDILKSENGYLRKQLQSLKNDEIQVRSDTEDFRAEKDDWRQSMEKLKDEGTDMNLEIQGLKKVEKVLKVEIESLRTGLEKVQEDTEELERERGTSQMEGVRERLLIMERVESLSQLYLGGLEEVRTDIFNVKFSCRDRVDELESQWSEFRRQQENSSEEGSAAVPRQMLLDELDHFRNEMAEMVEIERGLLRETLERESASIRRQVMDVYASNKSEMLSMLKLEVQKRLQSAREKVLLMTDALKRDMDNLKAELGHAREGAEDLSRAITVAERQKDVAAAAAADASMSATKAGDILTEMLGTFNNEMANARRKTVQLQENLAIEKDMAAAAASETRRVSQDLVKEKEFALVAVQEARQKNQELQEFLERESSKIMNTIIVVQKERDTASQAASEATSSALKAGEVLAEVLGSFNLEMAKARRLSMQLQEGLEKEREGLERERELAVHHSQEAQDRFSEELELAIAGWKRAMNAEVAKAKEVTEGLEEEKRRASFTYEQESLQLIPGFRAHHELEGYISKTEDALSSLTRTVKQLQDSRDNYHEEKRRRVMVKQQQLEKKERDWKSEITQLNLVVRAVEKRMNESSAEQTDVRKKLKKSEGTHSDLVNLVEEVRTNTSGLEKTVTMWLPKYEAAARVVNDLSSKVERMEEKFQDFDCDEGLLQQMSRVADSKVQGLKDLVSASSIKGIGSDLKELYERVEGGDRAHCQAITVIESRVKVLENSLGHSGGQPGLSLKLEYTENMDGNNGGNGHTEGMGSLSQSVEALERKMEMIAEQNDSLVGGPESGIDSRLLGLESRIEHVASATFTNLRLLDSKVERVSVGVQSALEGAALAESKCGALGAELVKVFRMLTACKQPNGNANNTTNNSNRRGRSHSPPTRNPNHRLQDSRSQSPPSRFSGNSNSSPSRNNRGVFSPMRRSGIYISPNRLKTVSKRGVRGNRGGESDFTKGTQSSELRKVTGRERDRGDSTYSGASEEGNMSPIKENWNYLRNFPRESMKECKLHSQALSVVDDRKQGECALDRQLTTSDKRQDGSGKNCQKTNIRLEAGRIHVNVSHRSAVLNQSEKRDLIAVQS